MADEDDKGLFGGGLFTPLFFALPIALVAFGGFVAFRGKDEMKAVLTRGEAEGRAFAVPKRSASECFDGAVLAMDRMNEPREPGAAAFFEACLETSGLEKTTGTKHSAPSRGLLDDWAKRECAARGRVGDAQCALFVGLANVDVCRAPFRGQAKAEARWQCP
ncbi:MAG: hypothetical protein IPG50_16340 [Myxococcales bacterium]|nr:hypothetical protein [Myxococcales bacterium]